MNLKHLKYTSCPTCGARVISEHQTHQHCNGQWFEEQHFKCGFEVHYMPNFSREEIRICCPHTPSEIEKKDKRDKAKNKVEKYIGQLGVDYAFKSKLWDAIKYI